MTATTAPTSPTTRPAAPSVTHNSTGSLVRAVGLSAVVAAAAIEGLAALVRACGVHLAVGGSELTFGACAVALAMCMVPALVLIAGIRRYSRRPARTFTRAALMLVAVSLVPDLAVQHTSLATRATLMATHLIAAAIIVPATAHRI